MHRACAILCALLALVLGAGCATHADRLRVARQHFHANQLQLAADELDEQIRRHKQDADVLKLDQAMVQLAAGQPQLAEPHAAGRPRPVRLPTAEERRRVGLVAGHRRQPTALRRRGL